MATTACKALRGRFAPLSREVPSSPGARRLEGIVFDVDGTLW